MLQFQDGAMLSLFMELLSADLDSSDMSAKLDICGVLINVAAGNKEQTEMLVFRTSAIRDFLDFIGQAATQTDDFTHLVYAGGGHGLGENSEGDFVFLFLDFIFFL